VFENIIGQPIIEQIKNDLESNTLPSSLLFAGGAATAKGSTALELARVLSCSASGEIALWNCKCPSCAHHRTLSHPDLICIGSRQFQCEIIAGKNILLRDPDNEAGKIFFQRAVKKLLLRFSNIVWEGDPKISKFNKTLEDINDEMDSLLQWNVNSKTNLEKLLAYIVDDTRKLESEGMTEFIPVSHVRNAAYWLRTTPNGRRKVLIIENAEKMNDAARNSLLKILEEPPETAVIILSSSKPEALLPTVLSRLRHYSFSKRSAKAESDIISRVFRDNSFGDAPAKENKILLYLEKFLPVSRETLYPAAAYFLASIAASAIVMQRKNKIEEPMLITIGKYAGPIASNFGRASADIKVIVATMRLAAEKFDPRSLYGKFLEKLCVVTGESLINESANALAVSYRNAVKEKTEESRIAVDIYNLQIELALEHLAYSLIVAFAKIKGV
jgi:DNA polymerase-3 subunit gamma/tau